MSEEAVSLATLKQTIQKLKENAKIMCFQCEKCGFIDTDSKEEFEAMPKEHQEFLLKHRQKCGGRFLPFKVVPLKDLEEVAVCVEKLQKQQEQKMNVIIRIKSLKAREHFARRLGFENLGHLIGGHPLSTEWKERDWLPENLPPFLGKRKVKEVLGEGNKP